MIYMFLEASSAAADAEARSVHRRQTPYRSCAWYYRDPSIRSHSHGIRCMECPPNMGHWCCVWDLPDASVCVHWYSTVLALALALGQLHRVLCVHSALLDCTSYVQHTDQELRRLGTQRYDISGPQNLQPQRRLHRRNRHHWQSSIG
jgi:hypothetical protein